MCYSLLCFPFHLWPLKQPCTDCLDGFRVLLGRANVPIMPSQVSLKPCASLSSIYEAQNLTSIFVVVRTVKVHSVVKWKDFIDTRIQFNGYKFFLMHM